MRVFLLTRRMPANRYRALTGGVGTPHPCGAPESTSPLGGRWRHHERPQVLRTSPVGGPGTAPKDNIEPTDRVADFRKERVGAAVV